MPNVELLRKYARLAVRIGANVQKGQPLLINTNLELKDFVRICVEEAYKAGASIVSVRYNDEINNHLNFEYQSEADLGTVPNYIVEQFKYYIEKGFALMSIYAETPGLMADIDPNKLQIAGIATNTALKPWREHTMGNRTQWCVISAPTVGWAQKVFPKLNPNDAVEKLWDAILSAVRVREDNDPVAEWEKHNQILRKHNQLLNDYNFKHLHFTNALGTDLTVELVKNHVWAGGNEKNTQGILFNPNMPTEENFSMPYKFGVNGKVVATKPLNFHGKLIEDFVLTFKDGKAVEYKAKKEEAALKDLLEFDPGSSYLGEVALISYDTPISKSNILFFNTLFDENASCHLALGKAYPMNVKGGNSMSQDELTALGSNDSMEHEDFMFGSEDMKIVGLTQDNKEVLVFKDGNFVF